MEKGAAGYPSLPLHYGLTNSGISRDLASRLPNFLTIAEDAEEQELERGLVAHIRQFLIELGAGFAFLGQQYRLEVGGEDYYLDLLFYHVKLRCYVVIDHRGRLAHKSETVSSTTPDRCPPAHCRRLRSRWAKLRRSGAR